MRRFVIIGRLASASPDFLLDDLPGTSGRMDVLARCVRAALLVSHGLRRDVVVYLVLLGGPQAPRVVAIDGSVAKFVRPDERSIATLIQKALAHEGAPAGFSSLRHGISIARGGLDVVFDALPPGARFVLEEGGADLRGLAGLDAAEVTFFIGDHLGFDPELRAELAARGAQPASVGPISLHSEDALVIVANELDRRERGA